MMLAIQVLKPLERKRKLVDELIELMSSYKTIALADITGLRALQFQRLRAKLRGMAAVKVAKNTLIRRALDELKEKKGINLTPLKDYLQGQIAIVATDQSPFEIYNFLEKNKVPAKAKPGDIAVKDIVLTAGNTGLTPGPVLSLFKKFKVPTRIEEGSIYVAKDTCVVKAGEPIPAELADLLTKLGIEPMEVGLRIKVAYSEGLVYKADDLKIDFDEYRRRLAEAASNAIALAVNATFITPESAPLIIAKAALEAKSLAINACYPTADSIGYILAKAHAQALALSSVVKLEG